MADTDPLVVFTPSGKRGRVPSGTPVLQAARSLGVDLDSVCGGRGICSRCQVSPSFGSFPKHNIVAAESALSAWNAVEARYDRVRGLKKGRRLGCQAQILGDMVIDVPAESQVHRQVVRKAADSRPVAMNPATRLLYAEVEEPDMHEPSGDFERVKAALAAQWNIKEIAADLTVLRKLQPTLRKGDWKATFAVYFPSDGTPCIVESWPGFYEGGIYGFAIDLGSTTIAAHLCDLRDGRVLASSGIMNPQIRFGEDLMSRVSYAMLNEGGANELTVAVRSALNALAAETASEAGVDGARILEIVFVCNPVMHHLLMGIDPVELGQAPFALATTAPVRATAREFDLSEVGAAAQVYCLPNIAGHVGADCAAVILSEQPHRSEDKVLMVDVGTNAEIVFGTRERVLACSSPTGPAFEGAQISSGQRAAAGAIERVEIDPETKEPRFRIIGSELSSDDPGFRESAADTGVTGICGSGIIEAIAEMRRCGIIDKSGLIGSAAQVGTERLIVDGRTNSYLLYDGTEQGGSKILVTQADVRAIQLAKSALYAGAKLLMDEFGASSVDRIVLAGAFGAHISPKHAMILGMIPDCLLENVVSAGNAAGTGARIALCSIDARKEIERVAHRIEKIETAVEPKFQEHFVNANSFPHAIDAFPNLESVVDLPEVNFNVAARRRQARKRAH